MSEQDKKIAEENQDKKQDEGKSGQEAEKTIGEELGNDKKPAKESNADDDEQEKVVPESAFLKEKSKRKQLEKDLKALQLKVASGDADEDEVADEIDAIAEEFDVDKKFVRKLAGAIKSKSEKELDAKYSSRLKPIEDEKKQDRIDKAFEKGFNKAMENMSDFKDIVNPDVIKTLSLDSKNSDKTFTQLIEETYGRALGGKRTIEPTKPRGGKDPEPIDFKRAQKDTKYFAEIMADPDRKKEYNSSLEKRLASAL